jgi:glycosyltransferase involved in cell wall biosynthesis
VSSLAHDLRGLRIGHLIESDGPGGAERVVAELATAFQAAGAWNVVFLPAEGEGWLARQLAGSGVALEHFRLEGPVSPHCARSLAAAFRRLRIDVAHSHEFSMAVYGAWAAWRAGVPHVITMHGGLYYAARLRRRLALRAAFARSGQAVAVSTPLAERLSRELRLPASRIATIPNGVRYVPSERTTLRDELRLGPGDRLLVSVGNLYPVKGHRHLVEALGLLGPRHSTVHVAIAGRGEGAIALAACARDRGLTDRVHLLGLRTDVAAVLAAADIFVLPSLSEGLPLALLEAMFAGRAIVASDVGDVGVALADGGSGVLVEAGDSAALAEALERLLDDPDRARDLGESAARRAAAEYDVSRMVRRYAATYEGLLGRRTSPRTEPMGAGASATGGSWPGA